MKKENKKRIIMGTSFMMTLCLGMGAFSYFTDYESKELTAKAGTLKMEIDKGATSDLTNGLTILNPGDSNPLQFTVNNIGEKSMDVKAVITVTSSLPMNVNDHEYKVTDDKGVELTNAALSNQNKTITYTIDDVVLAGKIEEDSEADKQMEKSHAYNYKFKMDEEAKNAFQGSNVSVKIETFAKQHRNTSTVGDDWISIVEQE